MRMMTALPMGSVFLVFTLMTLVHSAVGFRITPSNRQLPADEVQLGQTGDIDRFRDGVRDRYVLDRVLQAVAEIEGIEAMFKLDHDDDDNTDVKENFKRSDKSRPIITSRLSRLVNKRTAETRLNALTGAGQWSKDEGKERHAGGRKNSLDGQIEWLVSRVHPWRTSIHNNHNDESDSESYFGNHVDLIGSSIVG